MHMNNFFKYGVGLALVTIAAACSMSTSMDATLEKEVQTATVMRETAKAPTDLAPDDVVRVKNDIWLGDTSEIEYDGQPIPGYLENREGITLISNRPITLFEIGDMINKITSLKVRYAPGLEDNLKKSAQSNKPNPETINADWAEPDKMLVSYRGPLSGLLDEVSSRFGIWWKYDKKEIYFYKYITSTFVLYTLPSKPSLSVQVGGQTEGSNGNSSISLSSTVEVELWGNIEKAITSMVDKDSKLTIDSANGTISLTATPNDIKKVAKYINEQNARLSRQVAISVKVLQVSVDDSDSYGLDLSAVFDDGQSKVSLLSPVNSLGDEVAKNLEMRVMPGNWNLGASIQALSKQGTTNVVTSGTVTTLNNKPAPIQVVRKQNYISEITKTNSGGDGNYYDVSTETEEIETGFTMDVLPRILEHGRLLLMFNLTLSDLISLEKVPLGGNGEEDDGQYIQNPIIESRGFNQEVALKSGESLVLTGYERVNNTAEKTGVGSATNSLFGGTATASKERAILVIILTPVVLESPMNPETRVTNRI